MFNWATPHYNLAIRVSNFSSTSKKGLPQCRHVILLNEHSNSYIGSSLDLSNNTAYTTIQGDSKRMTLFQMSIFTKQNCAHKQILYQTTHRSIKFMLMYHKCSMCPP
jgi:hypothetical protein